MFFKFGKEVGIVLVVLLGIGLLLVPAFRPGGGVVFEANGDLGDT